MITVSEHRRQSTAFFFYWTYSFLYWTYSQALRGQAKHLSKAGLLEIGIVSAGLPDRLYAGLTVLDFYRNPCQRTSFQAKEL